MVAAVPTTTTTIMRPSHASARADYARRSALFFDKLIPHDVPFSPVEGSVLYCSQYGPSWCSQLKGLCRWNAKTSNCAALHPN